MPSSQLQRLVSAISAEWAAFKQARRIAQAVAELERYDSPMLRDIGISRDQIREFVEGSVSSAEDARRETAVRDIQQIAETSDVVVRMPVRRADGTMLPVERCVGKGCCEAA